jgi:hypothetical protein
MRKIVYLRVLLFAALASTLAFILPTVAQANYTETWVSGTGNDGNSASGCQVAAPCQTLGTAMSVTVPGGTVFCAGPSLLVGILTISQDLTIDCSQGSAASPANCAGGDGVDINTAGIKVTLRGLAIYNYDPVQSCTSGLVGVHITAAALVRIENCKIYGFSSAGVDVAPSSGNVVVKIQDSTITSNDAGILVVPTGSASVSISIDRSRIENNTGGGMKTDTTSGAITASISDSSVSFNGGNGLNTVSGSGAQNMLSLTRDIIALNGSAGLQANGGSTAVLVDETLLDSNTTGATESVSSGNLLTYGNNRVVGPPGSGFNGTAPLK